MAKGKANNEAPKKSRLAAAASAQPKKRNSGNGGLGAYFKGVKSEIKKVVWPTRKELGAYTALVLVACTFFAAGFWLIDTGFLALLKGLLGISLG